MEQNCTRSDPRSVFLGISRKSSNSDPWWVSRFAFRWEVSSPHHHFGLFPSYSS
ncbi:hypothetical protein ANCCAN_09035 [Ancylostoma caninum]|uniref:Uncharacterized protein n=1 Tax=Ancylostoma caninum TaxID=29170 RepID=A0A368GKN2_ANCCA|nr:hypothetical protein ANCCAN_09035 [Ancylostoma caninum]